jgi:F420-non-reducing hydrogenase iron-sulfur subunit
MNNFNPKVLVFCCNWCSYAGADLAGVSRLQIDPHFRVIRTMCSGRIQWCGRGSYNRMSPW